MKIEKEYLNLKESAELLGINEKLMRKLIYQKGFPCIRFKRRIVICKNKLEEWFINNSNLFIK